MTAVDSIPTGTPGPRSLGTGAFGAAALQRIESIRARFEPTATTPEQTAGTGQDFSEVLGTALGCTCDTCGVGTAASPGALGTGSGTPATGSSGEQIARTALEYLGIPYVWGGTDPATGLDCSGLVQHVLGRAGIEAPRVSAQQATMGVAVPSLAEARPGDLLAFGRPVDHIGIYLGGGRMVHAPHSGEVVQVDDVGRRPLSAIRRVTPSWAPATTTTPTPAVGWSALSNAPVAGTSGVSVLPAAIVPQVRRFEPLFVEAGRRWGIDPALLAAQCQRESAGDLSAVSSAGAVGIMQFMPSTAAARGVDPLDPASAIDGAARYLAEMRSAFGGSIELAIAAYAAGPGAVRRAGDAVPSAQVARYIDQILALAGGVR